MLRTPAPLIGALAVGTNMLTRVASARYVSVGFGVFGMGYLGFTAILLSSNWTGSFERLWIDMQLLSNTLSTLLLLAMIHLALCIAILRYAQRTLATRRAALVFAILLATAAGLRAMWTIRITLHGPATEFVTGTLLSTHLLSAIGYIVLAWTLGRIYFAVNTNLETTVAKPSA